MKLPEFRGKKIALRPMRAADVEHIPPLANDKRIARHVPRLPHPYTRKDARDWYRYLRRAVPRDEEYVFCIADLVTGKPLGMIGLSHFDWSNKKAELGYWLGVDFWGRGFATEAVALLLSFAFRQLKLHRVYAFVHADNPASARVLTKIGFEKEGCLRRAWKKSGRWVDILHFGILKEEYCCR